MRRLETTAALLALPLALLLFLQWPLRDLLQAGSRQANDAAQVVFAVYMAVAVAAAGRAGVHLSAHPGGDPAAGWRRWAVLACTAPWAAYLLAASAPGVWQSVRQLERFPDSLNPGYFLLRLALWLLAVLVLLDAARTALRRGR